MSYCRWSTDNFACDLYCYEDCLGGYTTHVSAGRYVDKGPKIPELTADNVVEYTESLNSQLNFLATCKVEPINLPHAGETFNDGTLEEFKERLLYLRGLGYRFPDYVLETIDEEIKDAHHD